MYIEDEFTIKQQNERDASDRTIKRIIWLKKGNVVTVIYNYLNGTKVEIFIASTSYEKDGDIYPAYEETIVYEMQSSNNTVELYGWGFHSEKGLHNYKIAEYSNGEKIADNEYGRD